MDKRLFHLIAVALIVILGFVIYANSLDGKFIWDDNILIKDNAFLRDWSNVPKIFSHDWGAGAGQNYNFYRPLCIFTHLVNYSIGTLNVTGYHLVNIMLHILVSLALYRLILILFGERILSLLASLLFVAHPVHTEVVSYISGRVDSLAALFMFVCFMFYVKSLAVDNLLFRILALLSYVLALLSKENSLILPLLILLYHYSFKKKIKIGFFNSLLLVSCVFIVLRLKILHSAQFFLLSPINALQRIPGVFIAIINYVRLLMLPFNLHMEYGKPLFSFTNPVALFGCVVSVLLLIYAVGRKNKNNLIFFSIFWFFITLLPVSNIYPIGFYMAEHYLYLPSIGFFLILANCIRFLYKSKKFRMLGISSAVGLLIFYSFLTIKQNGYWKEPIAFYERSLEYAPHTPRLLNWLGNAYTCEGKYKKAIVTFEEAMKNNPAYPKTYNNLGYVYATVGRDEKAIALFEQAIRLDPDYADAYSNLGSTYGINRQNKKAMTFYKKALEIDPYHVRSHCGLASIYYFEEHYDLAAEHRDKALKLGYSKIPPEIIELRSDK